MICKVTQYQKQHNPRSHITSYYLLFVEGRKFLLLHMYLAPSLGWPHWNFTRFRKLEQRHK